MARRIKKAKIDFISLVPKGANKMQALYKSDGSVVIETLTKVNNEAGELTAVVYAAEHEDSQGHIADAKVIKDMAYEYQRDRRQLDLRHDGKAIPVEKAFVAENFLVAKGDQRFVGWKDTDGKPVNLDGAWATVIKLEDPELRRLARDEKWSVSMAGTGVLEKEDLNDSVERFAEIFLGRIGKSLHKTEDDKMDPKDIEQINKSVVDSLKPTVDAIVELTKALKPAAPPKGDEGQGAGEPKEPIFKGRWEDEAAVRKHERELQIFELRKAHDTKTADGFRAFREEHTTLQKQWAEEDAAAKLEKASNQGGTGKGKGKDDESAPVAGVSIGLRKGESEAYEEGRTLFNPKLKKVS